MKSKLTGILLCLVTVIGVFFLVKDAVRDPEIPETSAKTTAEETTEPSTDENPVTRAYVIKTAHDTEDAFLALAYGKSGGYENAFSSLPERLRASSDFLKSAEIGDYEGAALFKELADIIDDVSENHFTSNADFSSRVGNILLSIDASYPSAKAKAANEKDAVNPMYYPNLDTDVNGSTTLALLAVYQEQKAKSGVISVTVGGGITVGDTFAASDIPGSYKDLSNRSDYPYPLYKLSAVLKNDTVSIAGLYSPLTDSTEAVSITGSIKGSPSYAVRLAECGIDILSIAHPGVSGYKDKGREDTKQALENANIKWSDDTRITYFDTEIGKIAVLSYDLVEKIKAGPFVDAPKNDIAAAKASGAKAVIVYFNWVTTERNKHEMSDNQALTQLRAIENGAALVVGSEAVYVGGIQRYNNTVTVYSAGTLVNKSEQATESLLYQQDFRLDKDGNLVKGEITLFPVCNGTGNDGVPFIMFDKANCDQIVQNLTSYSAAAKYGLNKTGYSDLTTASLNIITITK